MTRPINSVESETDNFVIALLSLGYTAVTGVDTRTWLGGVVHFRLSNTNIHSNWKTKKPVTRMIFFKFQVTYHLVFHLLQRAPSRESLCKCHNHTNDNRALKFENVLS